jgi:hypothetical protein
MKSSLRIVLALAIAAGSIAIFSQDASATGKRHHKPAASHSSQSKVEYLRAAGSPK